MKRNLQSYNEDSTISEDEELAAYPWIRKCWYLGDIRNVDCEPHISEES